MSRLPRRGRLDAAPPAHRDAVVVCIGRTDIRQSGVEQLNRGLLSELERSGIDHEWLDWASYTPTESRGMFSFSGVRGAVSTLTGLARACWRNRERGTVVYFPISQHGWGLARDLVTALVPVVSGGRKRTTVIHLHGEFRADLQPRPLLSRLGYSFVACMPRTSFVAQIRGLRFAGASSTFAPSRAHMSPGISRARHLAKSSEPTVVFLGFVAPSKGFHVLMQAFERLTTPVRLVVVGPVFDDLVRYEQRFCPVKEWDRVLSVLRSDNRIELVGPIYGDERFEYLRRAWACVLPSFTEGGSVVVQETLAVGTQMIATRVGPLPEMLEGTPGHRLVDPADADGLRKAIEECLQHPPNEPMGVSQAYLDGGATVFEVLAQQSGASR